MEVSSEHTDLLIEDSMEDALIQIENHEELVKLINGLGAIDREIFIMKFFLGVETDEIAVRFGLTSAAIDNRNYRGKKILQQKAMDM